MANDDRTKDEGTAPADASNAPHTSGAAPNTPEPVILEEHIVAPPAPAAAPAPQPPTPSPISTPPSPAPTPDATRDALAEEVGLPRANTAPPQDEPQPQPLSLNDSDVPKTGQMEGDIAHILEEAKLPERRSFRGSADTPLKIQQSPPAEPAAKREATPSEKPAPKPEKKTVTPVHTLKDDLQTVVHDQKISFVRAAALEEDRRARQQVTVVTATRGAQRKRLTGTITAITGLAALGFAAIAAVMFVQSGQESSVARLPTDSLLFSEQTVAFPLGTRAASDTKLLLAEARGSAALTLGAITRVAPTVEVVNESGETYTSLATTKEFFDAIGAGAPDELIRALGNDFFFGFHTVDENAPVFVALVSSYERAFAGMLAWEETMSVNLSPVYTTVPSLVQEEGLLKKRVFADVVMRNYDVRALKDDYGEIQLYYSFPTRHILIIAESAYSFAEILSRLRADRRI